MKFMSSVAILAMALQTDPPVKPVGELKP